MNEQIFTNARIVLVNEVILGSVFIQDGRIQDISLKKSYLSDALDMEGDYLMPGLVELHTDNIEKHTMPRPGTFWPSSIAVFSHDTQMIGAGITTVFNALSIGDIAEGSERIKRLHDMVSSLTHAKDANLLRADHHIHLRCELSFPFLEQRLTELKKHLLVNMLSIMDHTPGQRQFASLEECYSFYQSKYGFDNAAMKEFVDKCFRNRDQYAEKNKKLILDLVKERNFPLASHDDATEEHINEAIENGVTIVEFPATIEAGKAAKKLKLCVMVGGPNLVLGRSQSGNISGAELAKEQCLDIISSDYIPSSMLQAAMKLSNQFDEYDLPQAIRRVTKIPAECVGLTDRGEVHIGKRADLIQVRISDFGPIVKGVWREGRQVA